MFLQNRVLLVWTIKHLSPEINAPFDTKVIHDHHFMSKLVVFFRGWYFKRLLTFDLTVVHERILHRLFVVFFVSVKMVCVCKPKTVAEKRYLPCLFRKGELQMVLPKL